MTKEQIEQIRKLAESHDFKGVPIPALCDLALLGALLRDSWDAEYFQREANPYYEARRDLDIAKHEYLEAENKRRRGDFDKRWPGIL